MGSLLGWGASPHQPAYKATSVLYVAGTDNLRGFGVDELFERIERLVGSTGRMVSSGTVASEVVARAAVPRTATEIAASTTAHWIEGTQLLEVDAYDRDPRVAQRLANTLVDVIVSSSVADGVEQPEGSLPELPARVFSRATLPTTPEPSGTGRNTVVAGLMGLGIGWGVLLARRHADVTLTSASATEAHFDLPVLVSLPDLRPGRARRDEGGWPTVVAVGAAFLLVSLSVLLLLPPTMQLALGFSLPGGVFLLELGRERAISICIMTAAFLSTALVAVGSLQLGDVALALGFVVLVMTRAESHRPPLPRPLLWGLALMLFGGVIGIVFEPDISPFAVLTELTYSPGKFFIFDPQIGELIRFGWGTVGMLLLIRECRLPRRQIERALVAFCCGSIASVAAAVFGGEHITGRDMGLTSHPVFFGWISAYAAIVGVGLVLSTGRWQRRVGVVTIATGGVGILLSGTRSAFLILFLGLGFLQLGLRSARRSAIFLFVGMAVLSLALLGIFGDTPVANRLAGDESAQTSNQGRDEVRRLSIDLVREHGGTGIGFEFLFPPHNLILGVLAATGVIGFAGALIIVVFLFRRLIITPTYDTHVLAIIGATLGVYACAWVVNVGWDHWLWLPVALALYAPHPGAEPPPLDRVETDRLVEAAR